MRHERQKLNKLAHIVRVNDKQSGRSMAPVDVLGVSLDQGVLVARNDDSIVLGSPHHQLRVFVPMGGPPFPTLTTSMAS